MDWYEANQVDVIPKYMNPPNCPKIRPIEKFWSIVKGTLKKTSNASKNITQMQQKWNRQARNESKGLVQQLMSTSKPRTGEIFRLNA